MPPTLKEKPEELWQLEEHSPFPDEVEIVVFEEHPLKGYIRPKGNLNTPFTMENIIEIVYFKKFVSKGICIGIYTTAIYSKKDFTNTPEQIYFWEFKVGHYVQIFSKLGRKWILSCWLQLIYSFKRLPKLVLGNIDVKLKLRV